MHGVRRHQGEEWKRSAGDLMLAHKKELHCNTITAEVRRCSVVSDATCRAVKASKAGTRTLTAQRCLWQSRGRGLQG
jgi:hypothetical protein